MSSERNPVISISRVLGMLFIILCHIIKYYSFIPGSSFLGQFFISGVQLFIFISGYLYGGKTVAHFGKWYAKRALTVSLPAILLSIIVMLILAITGTHISGTTILAYSLDLEGLLFLNSHISLLFKSIASLDPLWFTTVIMLCYLMIPLLQKVEKPTLHPQRAIMITFFLLIGTGICIILFSLINLTYFFFFTIGYFLGKTHFLEKIQIKFFTIYTIIFVASLIGRVLLHHYADNTIIYAAYAEFARFIIGTWFVALLSFVYHKIPTAITAIANWKIVKWLDAHSFYIYLTHGVFCMGVFNLYNALTLPLATLTFLVCTVTSAVTLKWVCNILTSPISSHLKV